MRWMDQILLLLLLLLLPILSNQSSARVLLSSVIQANRSRPSSVQKQRKASFLIRNGDVGTHALENLSPLVVGRVVYRLPVSGERVRFSDVRRRHAASSSSQCQTQHLCARPSAAILGWGVVGCASAHSPPYWSIGDSLLKPGTLVWRVRLQAFTLWASDTRLLYGGRKKIKTLFYYPDSTCISWDLFMDFAKDTIIPLHGYGKSGWGSGTSVKPCSHSVAGPGWKSVFLFLFFPFLEQQIYCNIIHISQIHPFKVYTFHGFSILTELCNHHNNLSLEYFHHSKKKFHSHYQLSSVSPPLLATGKH